MKKGESGALNCAAQGAAALHAGGGRGGKGGGGRAHLDHALLALLRTRRAVQAQVPVAAHGEVVVEDVHEGRALGRAEGVNDG